jgi:hypothetical protein
MIASALLILAGLFAINRARDPVLCHLGLIAIIGGAAFAVGKALP